MCENKIVRKSFWAHQYEKEENYLRAMRLKGWKFIALHKALLSAKYEFEKCEPEEYIYQLDYIKVEEDTISYHQLFKDAEWEEIYSWDGVYNGKWFYYCKKVKNGKKEKLYTDSQSQLELVNKLFKTYGIIYLVLICSYILQLISSSMLIPYPYNLWVIIPFTILLILMGYFEVGILLLRKRLINQYYQFK
jgi:hypothetical protein